jgi:hypothetical protein
MALKDLDQLVAEIDAAVHPNGPLGKTTAPGLNALLKSLATELTARPGGTGATAAGGALEFVFEASFADVMGRTLGPRQAGTYASELSQNVDSVTYQVNGVVQPAPKSQPLVLASGDVLQVALTRADPALPAVLTLLS